MKHKSFLQSIICQKSLRFMYNLNIKNIQERFVVCQAILIDANTWALTFVIALFRAK